MEKKIIFDGQNTPVSNYIINMCFDSGSTKNQDCMSKLNFTEQMHDPYTDIYLLEMFLQNPQFINDMNFELFMQLLNNIPYNKSIYGAISLLEIYINNINKFNPDFTDDILSKIISKLCYTDGVINGNEELWMTFDINEEFMEVISTSTVFKNIILPLISSNNIELMKKITSTIFQHSQKEFCFLFIRTCIEFYNMIPQAFLHEMFGIGKQNEVHNTVKEFIMNDIQNVLVTLSSYNNIDFILMYLNEIISESNDIVLGNLNINKNILSYDVTHHYSTTRYKINIEEIKNTELKIFIQNLMNGIVQPIQIVPTNLNNKKLQNILSNFNDVINGRIQFYDIQNYIEEITILCEYTDIDYILLELYRANFINRELITFAINLFLTKYDKIKSIELKQLYIKLIQQEQNLHFNNVSSFTNNYDKFDDYLKLGIQEKFNNLAIELFNPAYASECIQLLCLLEKIHGNKVDEILLPIFIKNSEYLNRKQKAFIKEYIFANIFRNEIRPINMCFDIQDINGNTVLKYEIQSVKKINKLALIECLDIFYNNIENYCETKEGNEAIIIANLPHIIGIIDNLECNIEDKLELKTKIFLDVQKMLKNSNIEIFDDKNEAIEFLLTEIKKESIKNPEIVSYFLTNKEEKNITENKIIFSCSNKNDKGFIFNVLLLAEKQDKIKIQQSFMNYLDINLKKGNTNLLELYCDNIEKFDKEFGQIIFYKALEYGTLSLNIESLKYNISK